MVNSILNHEIIWKAPSPLWDQNGATPDGDIGKVPDRPAILRFAEDSFMDDFFNLVKNNHGQLRKWVAQPETWNEPMLNPKISSSENGSEEQIDFTNFKLYQPTQQRYYLVTASLVCYRPGLPDRRIDLGNQENVTFVVRRLVSPDPNNPALVDPYNPAFVEPNNRDEYAFTIASNGGEWQKIGGDNAYKVEDLIPNEEQLPMFAVDFTEDNGRKRRILAGLIPVGKREAYLGAGECLGDGETNGSDDNETLSLDDPRLLELHTKVIEPWKRLVEDVEAKREMDTINVTPGPSPLEDVVGAEPVTSGDQYGSSEKSLIKKSREQIQTISWYILLDFATLLDKHLNNVWQMIQNPAQRSSNPPGNDNDLFDEIELVTIDDENFKAALVEETAYIKNNVKSSLREALASIKEYEETLKSVNVPYNRARVDDNENLIIDNNWPEFLFPLADPIYIEPLEEVYVDVENNLKSTIPRIEELAKLIEKALPELPQEAKSAKPLAAREVMDPNEGWFRIRCVYNRPKCPLEPYILSKEPSRAFQLAGFFDPDAPARPIRIPLPVDVSPAGLRKFNKNTAFMISDMLCGHIKRIRKLTLGDLVLSVLPWPFHKDLPEPGPEGPCSDDDGGFGMMCSLSIPIVTLCALILLIIIVKLFDTFFKWFPFLFTCFPLPGFERKKQ